MDLAKILPMAFVMIAGPQILSAIFLATSDDWRRNSIAYISGAALSITAIVIAAYYLGSGAANGGASNEAIYVVILVLLVATAVQTYRKREESKPPKWMGKLQTARPGFSFKLGLLLLRTRVVTLREGHIRQPTLELRIVAEALEQLSVIRSSPPTSGHQTGHQSEDNSEELRQQHSLEPG